MGITGDMTPDATTTGNDQDRRDTPAALLSAAREAYAREAERGRAGSDTASRYAARMDGVVQAVVESARALTATPLAVCALGGYGRQALCLNSDIDLLIVFGGAIGGPEERFVNAVLQPLWDLRLALGHHVRELAEFDEPDVTNPEFLLALLDLRPIAGDQKVFDPLALLARDARYLRSALDPLMALVSERHREFNDTLYQLEPDIKSAPGGLRDIVAVRHLRILRPDIASRENGAGAGRLEEAEDFILRIRSVLHLQSGRDLNHLTHELQEKVAETLGSAGSHPHQRVEALMGEYFLRARGVVRSLESAQRAVRPPATDGTVRRVGRQFEVTATGVRFIDLERAAGQPSLWLEALRIALEHECGLAPEALACIADNVPRCTADDFVSTEGERLQLLKLLKPRRGLYARLSDMHDCGLLNRIFPEFAKIHCRVVRDFYHKYTVDEHTLLAIRGVESLLDPPNVPRRRFGSLLKEAHAPELLTLALLFHDVGKWREADHAQESLRLAQGMLDRLELGDESRMTVEFLIREHLQMSQVAFRRDSEDPHVIAGFADLVGTEENLKLLTLLTFVDIGAVSPDTLTPWKEDVLWRVYVDTYNRLTLGYGDELVERDPAALSVLVSGRPSDITEPELLRFLEGLPRRYLSSFGLGAVYRHVRLARGIGPDEVHTFLEKHDDVWEITIVTLDKPFLFSNISGVLSYFGMDIHRGQAMTTPDGMVLDVFQFTDEESFLEQNPTASVDICRMLEDAVAGRVDVRALLRGRLKSVLHRRRKRAPAIVHGDNQHSRKYTVLEIVADDEPGLLHRISRAVSGEGCDVHLVLIATEGKRAIDVLHVTKEGAKVSDEDLSALSRRLEQVLEDGDEAH
jgi:[protein-PII] uridylyltransferase